MRPFYFIIGIILIAVGIYYLNKNHNNSNSPVEKNFWLTYGSLVLGSALLIGSLRIEILTSLGILVLFILLIYYCIQLYQNRNKAKEKRKSQWTSRLILVIVSLFAIGFAGEINGNQKADHSSNQQTSQKHNNNKQKPKPKKSENSNDQKEKNNKETENEKQKADNPEQKKDDVQKQNDNNQQEDENSQQKQNQQTDDANKQSVDQSANQSNSSSNNQQVNDSTKVNSTSGAVVGNSKTMTYHTADQANYRISSSNVVYFNSEADAQAAGYHKSLR
ncbi:hypothetical protein M3M39_03290 [Fructilactobacillus hinvesii]|uniref:DUF308 domain-containing protein n=1 Tax=Fructilactobacillus hinvesii TaxID=2940300 RepID=A0ABY5BTR9_9LACO|nr:hypothetical protein [Fructilactobacillus hinvesii]USS88512.1 hypothetical protein M3M39_03290 [Fructilactobacillus hinvesii]